MYVPRYLPYSYCVYKHVNVCEKYLKSVKYKVLHYQNNPYKIPIYQVINTNKHVLGNISDIKTSYIQITGTGFYRFQNQ